VAFIQQDYQTQHGIMSLSAFLKEKGFITDVLIMDYDGDSVIDNILRFNPDIIAGSVMTAGVKRDLDVYKKLKAKRPNLFVIMGGTHPTFHPEVLEQNISVVLIFYLTVGLQNPEKYCLILIR